MANRDEEDEVGPFPVDPGVSRAKFQRMLDDVRRLRHRWGADLDHIIRHVDLMIWEAEDRLARSRKAPKGAPNLWCHDNLVDIWRAVIEWRRVLNCTVEEACEHLAKLGYYISATDYSGPVARSFERTIRSSTTLRAAYYKAEKMRKSIEARARKNTEGKTKP
jgi:hypothetical protein